MHSWQRFPEGRFPDFVGVGGAKCGSTSLYFYLREHPDIYLSPIKETNYFSTDIDIQKFSDEHKRLLEQNHFDIKEYLNGDNPEWKWEAFVKNEEDYKNLFRFAGKEEVCGEFSNSYLYSQEAARNIYRSIPSSKILMVIRDPIQRAYSQYLANVRDGRTTRGFLDEVMSDYRNGQKGWYESKLYIELGMYSQQIKRYLDAFPRENVKVILTEELSANPRATMKEVFRYLGVREDAEIDFRHRSNIAKLPRSKWLLYLASRSGAKKRIFKLVPERYKKPVKEMFFKREQKPLLADRDKEILRQIYIDDVKKLESMIDKDLSGWLA